MCLLFPVVGLQALHRGAHGVQPALARLLREFLLVLGSRLLHNRFLLSIFCDLLYFFTKG